MTETILPQLLASYLAARAHHAEASRQVRRAERIADKLAKRHGGSDAAWARACKVVGFDLADHRSLAAYRAMMFAREALLAALRGTPLQTRLRVIGAVLCADLPRPANSHGAPDRGNSLARVHDRGNATPACRQRIGNAITLPLICVRLSPADDGREKAPCSTFGGGTSLRWSAALVCCSRPRRDGRARSSRRCR